MKRVFGFFVLAFCLVTIVWYAGKNFSKNKSNINANSKGKITIDDNQGAIPNYKSGQDQNDPDKGVIDKGMYVGSGFKSIYTVEANKGKKLNFWVKNKSNTPVIIKIDDIKSAEIAAMSDGFISVEISEASKKYTFTAAPKEGVDVNVEYRIAQRSE